MGLTRTRVRVEGIVQGVGFRPFVHALAGRLGLAGLVGNDAGGVFVEVEGAAETVERFLEALAAEAPPLAVIERVTATRLAPTGAEGFAIAPSRAGGERQALATQAGHDPLAPPVRPVWPVRPPSGRTAGSRPPNLAARTRGRPA